jgi:formylglycine-generating enzyme required for sulfatase activity
VVRLEEGVFVARTPVTNAQYARFVAATGHEPPQHWKGKAPPDELRDHPVVYVSWHDAVAYAEWAGVRLLSEQEWEKAARGIDGCLYPWGDEFDPSRCNTRESNIDTTTPVGRYSPRLHPEQRPEPACPERSRRVEGLVKGGDSPCGCADMSGNVWEWTANEWEPGSGARVLRGGSFIHDGDLARCAYRLWDLPHFRLRNYGVRVGLAAAPFSPLGTTEALKEDEDTER